MNLAEFSGHPPPTRTRNKHALSLALTPSCFLPPTHFFTLQKKLLIPSEQKNLIYPLTDQMGPTTTLTEKGPQVFFSLEDPRSEAFL